MKITTVDELLGSVLDAIECLENSLLVWGVVDGFSTETDVLAIISEITDEHWDDVEELVTDSDDYTNSIFVLKKLTEKGLIFELPFTEGSPRYRSRMAETVRLLFHLRQMFPKHGNGDAYLGAKTLVADYRFKRARRSYPKRNLPASEFLEQMGQSDTKVISALASLSDGRPGIENFMLADFQLRATKAILDSISVQDDRGILISAGTGSGKTLAFYLPALSRICELIQGEENDNRWVKALAIYPRNELLKDQFRDVFGEARLLDETLDKNNKRKIQIGALFGPTPSNSNQIKNDQEWRDNNGWGETENGYVCPYISCIHCSDQLIWKIEDLNRQQEVLHCANNECNFVICHDEIVLTRDRIRKITPDILFTSTEMMNRHLSNKYLRGVFGAFPHASKAPEMILLDEVHTYQSFTGAQIAFLLRRWRNALSYGSSVTFIGLSATLKDGERFFSELCGLKVDCVSEIKPLPAQMEKEGAEYTIVLRGDPVSRAALLSTTIQTAMLVSRSLDERGSRISDGFFGTKLFAFTDKLDVINRLEPNLLDAEARDRYGSPLPMDPLASLREPKNSKTRYANGQDWRMCIDIGHHLTTKKNVSKTTSQDPGVNLESDIVIATATLEVGFNETNVGAVIQHKAPRSMAPYIQRKGRAGRTRKMRPWTAVVLSDYGRDRLVYMAYEQLFDPELPANTLPLNNRYIARIQAVYCLIEYLSKEVKGLKSSRTMRTWLSHPYEAKNDAGAAIEIAREINKPLRDILKSILEEPNTLEDFSSYLKESLGLKHDELQSILWDHPRPLITAVIPTALRRLSTNWKNADGEVDYYLRDAPLPEFATQTLFDDLNLPEVIIKMPEHQPGENKMMSVSFAMKEFAPGRISKRFSASATLKHWVCPENITEGMCSLELPNCYEFSELGSWSMIEGAAVVSIPVLRILSIQLQQAEREYGDTSNARLKWHTQILARENGTHLAPPKGVPVEHLIESFQIFTHEDQNPIEIRRFSKNSNADIRLRQGEGFKTQIDFMRDNAPVAVGVSMVVDAFRIGLRSSFNFLSDLNLSELAIRGLRTARYVSAAKSGEYLPTVDNPFAREWLANIYLIAVVHHAISTASSLRSASDEVHRGESDLLLREVLDTIFHTYNEIDPETGDQEGSQDDALRRELDDLLQNPEVLAGLSNLSSLLWSDIDDNWDVWLREKSKATIAGAIYYTIQQLCPQIDVDNLAVDICPGPRDDGDVFFNEDINYEIWISEMSPGGNGLIHSFSQSFNDEPSIFFNLLHSTLEANEFEIVDRQLTRFLNEETGSSIAQSVAKYRATESILDQDAAFSGIRHSLSENGYSVFHSFLSSFSARIMRPGSNPDTDHFFKLGINQWKEEEERLGIEIDARIFSYYWSQNVEAQEFLTSFGVQNQGQGTTDRNWLYNVIYGMFWPRGRLARESGIQLYSEFSQLPEPERLLFANIDRLVPGTVKSSSENWLEEVTGYLLKDGSAVVECPLQELETLSGIVNRLAVEPIEVSYLKSFVRITELEQSDKVIRAKFELPEIFK